MTKAKVQCIAHKTEHGIDLRCVKDNKHPGRHRWEVDEGFYPFGRLDPDNFLDQAFVNAWNKGAAKSLSSSQRQSEEPPLPSH